MCPAEVSLLVVADVWETLHRYELIITPYRGDLVPVLHLNQLHDAVVTIKPLLTQHAPVRHAPSHLIDEQGRA